MRQVPILFIIFNRPETAKIVFEAIRSAKPLHLYIAADAARENLPSDIDKCNEARSLTECIDWPCTVQRLYQKSNLGCSLGPRAAFDWFFKMEKEGIILEDDCVPHPDFFTFATAMLEKYRDNKKILSINGSNLGYEYITNESYTFSRFMNMWGWATWADRACAIDYSIAKWKTIKNPNFYLYKKLRQHVFDADIFWYKYWQNKFDLTINRKNVTWWDWQWIFHQISTAQLTVVPANNLVTNIGFNQEATHTHESANPAANLPFKTLPTPYMHPLKIEADLKYEEEKIKWVWCYHKRASFKTNIKTILKTLIFR